MATTLFSKVWDDHVVEERPDGSVLLYIDRHLVHDATSPQAFSALRAEGRRARHPAASLAVADHLVPTDGRAAAPRLAVQIAALEANAREFGIPVLPLGSPTQGIVHVVGPEQGFVLPGLTVVCGDSHTSTHGAFGALAFGIGTSEVEHVIATQTLVQTRPREMRITIAGRPGPGVAAKDVALAVIASIGAAGGAGHAIEYAGPTVAAMAMEERMTLCNMTIEAGARTGMIAPDATTLDWLEGRPMAPSGADWQAATGHWRTLASDPGARFDREVAVDVSGLEPQVTWGINPAQTVAVTGRVPDPEAIADAGLRQAARRALAYMDLAPGTAMTAIRPSRVFIGSCTNARLSDLRAAAAVARGRRVADGVIAQVVPGSGLVRRAAEAEGLDRIFIEAGFQWHEPGCSMCVAINGDRVPAGERCASTSNRNFEGRQGPGARTHLVSPAMAAAAAIAGRFVDVREMI
ncbi:3-isopropylmalate dehydratase large subunit [Allostella sp. ATCC 35155]|nr:3-isopropylmalate dehydratase large subunit [Stella sp. ATCC 35155]